MSVFIFKLPDLGEGLVEAEIAEWMVKVGDSIEEEDIFGAVLTDKAAVKLSSPVSGKVVSLAGEVGDTVLVGSALITFETEHMPEEADATPVDTPTTAEQVAEVTTSDTPVPVETTPAPGHKILTSPSIRKHAYEAGINLNLVSGSGPHGRIQKTDLEAYIQQGAAHPAVAPALRRAATEINEFKVVGLRRKIAERMTAANREIPHFAYVEEIDISALESLRQHLNQQRSEADEKLTLLPFLSMALVRALEKFPQCNAHYNSEKNTISQFAAVHLGIATQTPGGLKVPVIKHSEALDLQGIAREIKRLSTAARENKVTRDELMGSTITITSLGKQGGVVSTPVINMPEVAIIGVNKAIDRPMVVDGQIVIRKMMNLSSSFDNRFVDGYDGAMMIQELKGLLEQPATIFMP